MPSCGRGERNIKNVFFKLHVFYWIIILFCTRCKPPENTSKKLVDDLSVCKIKQCMCLQYQLFLVTKTLLLHYLK